MKKRDSEKKIERKLHDEIKSVGGLCLKMVTMHFTGLPDRICLLPGARVEFVETKSTGDQPSKRQIIVHKILRDLGFNVHVIGTMDALNKFITEIKCGE